MPVVFISYSNKDRKVADEVCSALERSGISCWIAPRDVPPGAEYADSIVDAIHNSRILVLILSSSANSSRQVKAEMQTAFEKGTTIVPFRIENILPTGAMKHYIGTFHWLDAFGQPLKDSLDKLAESVRKQLYISGDEAPPGVVVEPPVRQARFSLLRYSWVLIPLIILAGFAYIYFGKFHGGNIPESGLEAALRELAGSTERACKTAGAKYNLTAEADKASYNPGDSLGLIVSVDDDCYLYLLNVYYDRGIELFFPSEGFKDNLVNKGRHPILEITGGYPGVDLDSKGGTEYIWVIASPIRLALEGLLGNSAAAASGGNVEGQATQDALTRLTDGIIKEFDILKGDKTQAKIGITDIVSGKSLAFALVKYKVKDVGSG